jgi:DNA-binding protein YbaB
MQQSDDAGGAGAVARVLRETEVTVRSTDRQISVVVVPGNIVTGLEIAPAALRTRRGAGLARMILETIQEAFRQLAEQVADRIGDLVPASVDPAEWQGIVAGRLPDLRAVGNGQPIEEVGEPELPAEWAARGMPARVAEAAETWEAFEAKLQRLSAVDPAAMAGFAAAESTGRSPGGEVAVTVRAGAVVDVTISDAAPRDCDWLAAQVLAAYQQAQVGLASQLAEHAQALAGPALDVRDLVSRHQPCEEGR